MSHLGKIKFLLLKSYQFLISLKLAVFVLSSWAILTAIGTFVESKYNQEMANKLIYHSYWMAIVCFLLAINLSMVLIDRWPWKKQQAGFVLAHFGILTLMLGSLFSRYFGIDGSIRFEEGTKASTLSVSDMEIKIYSSYDVKNFHLIYEQPVDFFFIRPTKKKPYIIETAGQTFTVDQYRPFAVGRQVFQPTAKGGRPALRFHLEGAKASVVEWIYLEMGKKTLSQKFGPSTVSLTTDHNYKPSSSKEIVLFTNGNKLFYSLFQGHKKILKPGTVFSTGWMDFKFRLLEFFPKAQKEFIFESREKPSDRTVKAIRINHQEQSVWMGQNSYIRFFKEDRVYAIAYLNKTYDLGFELELLDFRMKRYEGSNKAKSYESEVRFEDQTTVIWMNEPLKHKGWTFYQSSFEPSPEGGEPVVSILSVNRDPGRFVKYAGSALIVIGIMLLFYRRRIQSFQKT